MKQNVTVAIIVYGKVQGVGFRPLVCRLAKENKLTGFVRNAGTHVEIIATGFPDAIQQLCERLYKAELPVRVEKLLCETVLHQQFENFVSVASTESDEVRSVSADIGICENCLRELKEKGNRRQGYPVPNAGRATQLSASCRMTVPTRPWISLRCVMTVRKSTATCRTAVVTGKPFPVTIADRNCNVL